MYYEERWIDGRLYWRSTPTGEWIEADAAKLNRLLLEARANLNYERLTANV